MSKDHVELERRGLVAIIRLDRAERKNAMNRAMFAALGSIAAELAVRLPRAVVVTGAGGAFSAGMDVNPDNPHVAGIIEAVRAGEREPVAAMLAEIHAALDPLFALDVPLIAAVDGLAYGGGAELATRCDLRVADPNATFCFSEVKLGLMPDWGGGVALARLIGPSRAAELVLTARKVGADEALRLGLVNRISAPGAALEEAITLAESIARNGPRAVRSALSLLRSAGDLARADAIAHERELAIDLIASGECVHGITAFLTGKAADFPDPQS